jgi:hypothetical protein
MEAELGKTLDIQEVASVMEGRLINLFEMEKI